MFGVLVIIVRFVVAEGGGGCVVSGYACICWVFVVEFLWCIVCGWGRAPA